MQLTTLQELARYWAADYDWRACEETLNAVPMFKTEIDAVDVHFIHVKSPHENALPLIMTQGFPGRHFAVVVGAALGGVAEPARALACALAGWDYRRIGALDLVLAAISR